MTAAVVLVSAACSGGASNSVGSPDLSSLPSSESSADAAATRVEHGPAADSQILLINSTGNLVVVNDDGSDPRLLGSADAQVTSPVWSPDGSRIAWTEVEAAAFGGIDVSLVTANFDGSDPTRIVTPFPSFYSYWDPTSQSVAILGDDPDGVGLAFADADQDGEALQVDVAAPYYLVWDPTGSSLLAHAGNSLRLVIPSGEISDFTIGSGLYQSPGIIGDEGEIIFAEGADPLGELKLGQLGSGEITTLIGYQGNAWLEVDPSGTRVALQSTGRIGTPAEDEADPLAGLDFEVVDRGLDIIEISTGEATRVSDDPAAAYFWSPDGNQLLVAAIETVDGVLWLQWKIWSDGELEAVGDRFQPSSSLGGSVMPFFDQYSLSHSLWAPDGEHFTYAGTDQLGDSGVWVMDTLTGEATLIVEGAVLSFWSPT